MNDNLIKQQFSNNEVSKEPSVEECIAGLGDPTGDSRGDVR